MKTFISCIIISVLSIPVYSQEETLLGDKIDHGGFAAPVVKITQIRGDVGVLVGGYGGWLINHQFMIGGGGYGLVSDVRASAAAEAKYGASNRNLYIDFGYGGAVFEFIYEPNRVIHLTVNTLIGAGALDYRNRYYGSTWDGNYNLGTMHGYTDIFFVLEPSVNIELNMTIWFRLGIGGSYRYVNGVNALEGISNADLRGGTVNLTLKFGSF